MFEKNFTTVGTREIFSNEEHENSVSIFNDKINRPLSHHE